MIRAGLAAVAAAGVEGHPEVRHLGDDCVELLRLAGALHFEAARRLGHFVAADGPQTDDTPSAAHWLGRRARLRPIEANQLVTLARRLDLLTETVNEYEVGRIGYGDLATIAEGIDRAARSMSDEWPPERVADAAQPLLLEAAKTSTPGQLRKVATSVALTLDGHSAEQRRSQIERQAFLNASQDIDGLCRLRAEMGAADLAIVEKAIDAFSPKPDKDVVTWQNLPGQRRLRGLITACEIALTNAGEHGYRERGGAPVKVHLIAAAPAADPAVPADDAPSARTEFGTILSAGQLRDMIRRHQADSLTIRVGADGTVTDQHDSDGRPLNWGRTRRSFTSAQREVYLALYAGCAVAGCDQPVGWTDIDHRREWSDGGPTDLDNGQPLCIWHNLHKEHQRVRRRQARRDGESADSDP